MFNFNFETNNNIFSVFQYTTRGLFECDKQIFTVHMAFQILLMNKKLNPSELDEHFQKGSKPSHQF